MIAFIYSNTESSDDREFMLRLYNEYHRLMYFIAKKYIPNSREWDDVVQESLLKLMKRLESLRDLDRFALAAYIVTTVKNTALNYLKKEDKIRKHTIPLDEDTASELEPLALSLDEIVSSMEDKERLVSVLLELQGEDRLLIEGKYFLNYSDEELARLVNCTPGSIRMKLTRVRRKILNSMLDVEGGIENDKA